MYTGVGLYIHIRSRKRRHGSGNKDEPAKEAAAEAGRAADTSHCSQPQFPIVQSQLPQGGLFEPVGCPPRLSTPGGFSQSSFMQSITSSKKSGSFMAGKLMSYPADVLDTNKTAMHQLGAGAQHAQQAQQQHAASSSYLIRSGVAQHAQRDIVDTPRAEEALSQEAAAAEAALESFSRASSQTALHSSHTVAANPLPANAPTDADDQAAAQEAAHQAAPSATPFQLNLASQQRGISKTGPTQQMMSQSGRSVGTSQGSKGSRPGVLPLQGYPAEATGTGARSGGLQLTAPNGQSLTQAQVNAAHLTFRVRTICQLCILTVAHCATNMHGINTHGTRMHGTRMRGTRMHGTRMHVTCMHV